MGKFTGKERPAFLDGLVTEETVNPVYKDTPTPTHEEVDVDIDVEVDAHTYSVTYAPTKKENRSHKLNLLMEPSKVKALKSYAKKYGVSMSDIINHLVEEFIKNNA